LTTRTLTALRLLYQGARTEKAHLKQCFKNSCKTSQIIIVIILMIP
jgi:hypothetical protein